MGQQNETIRTQALRKGLGALSADPENEEMLLENRNMGYEQAKALLEDPEAGAYEKEFAQKMMDKRLDSVGGTFGNLVRGGLYGAAEGFATPMVTRAFSKDSGIPTGGNTAARIAGNLAGSVFGLGKVAGGMKLLQAPWKMAAAYGAYGLGQGIGSHDEAEQQKAGQRAFTTATGGEIPSYMEASSATSVPGMTNIAGQAVLSALSGGFGQKANLAKLPYTRASLMANTAEGFGSGGLMLNDAMGGPKGVMDAFNDNPEGMLKTAGVLLGMGSASAAAPVAFNKLPGWLGGRSAKQRTIENADPPMAEPAPPVYQDPSPMAFEDQSFETLRGVVSPEMLNALKLSRMREMAERSPIEADRRMGRSIVDQTNGTFISVDPQSGKAFQVRAKYDPDTMDEIGLDARRSGSWGLTEIGGEGKEILASTDFLHNNLALRWQPPGGGKSIAIPPGFEPRAYPQERTLMTSGGEAKVKIIAAGPKESLILNSEGGLSKIPNSQLKEMPKADTANAPQNPPGDPLQRKGFSQEIPSISEFPNWMDSIETALGIQRSDMASHQVGKQLDSAPPVAEPWDSPPTLPFDFDDILRAREWDLTKSTPARPRR